MRCRGLNETAVKYNRYVVNGKLFRTLAHDVGRRTQNSGVCVPTVEGETYYGQLTDIVEVEYYDRTTYVLFKCNWADLTMDRGFTIDEYGLVFVNFNHLVHMGELMKDEPYVLTSQVDQVFYVEDSRNPNWVCVVRTNRAMCKKLVRGKGVMGQVQPTMSAYRSYKPLMTYPIRMTNSSTTGPTLIRSKLP
jgi:hypothetical protein